jgi:ACS family tartrate transporter-like MFS transporter
MAELPASSLSERTRRRVVLHLIPYLFFLYILAYLDRANVSVAMDGMIKPPDEGGLAFTKFIAGFGTGLFFWGYWILEIPSTQSVLTFGARWVFVRILILWGMACLMIGFIGLPWFNHLFSWLPGVEYWPLNWIFPHTAPVPEGTDPATVLQPDTRVVAQFYFLRFMLGFFEGGFFPAVIMYLSIWFRPQDRGRAIATFMAAIPVALMLGTPLSELILRVEWFDLAGWRWVYILQGIVPILAGIVTIWLLPDRPEKAKWLPAEEKIWLVGELADEQSSKKGHGHSWGGQVGIVLLLTLFYFGMNVGSYGLTTFMPDLFKTQSGLRKDVAGYLAGVPYVFGLLGMLVNGWHSDRTGERVFHVALPMAGMSVGLILAATAVALGQGWLAVIFLSLVVGPCMYAHLPAFWPIPTIFMGAASAAAAIGFINMIGNLGGSVGPTVFGWAASRKFYAMGLYILSVFPLLSSAVILIVGYVRRDNLRANREAHLAAQDLAG